MTRGAPRFLKNLPLPSRRTQRSNIRVQTLRPETNFQGSSQSEAAASKDEIVKRVVKDGGKREIKVDGTKESQ